MVITPWGTTQGVYRHKEECADGEPSRDANAGAEPCRKDGEWKCLSMGVVRQQKRRFETEARPE